LILFFLFFFSFFLFFSFFFTPLFFSDFSLFLCFLCARHHNANQVFTARNKREHLSDILSGIRGCRASGGTHFWEALRDGLAVFGPSDDSFEQWVVALTDGQDTNFRGPQAPDIAKLVRASAANVLCIGVGRLRTADQIRSVCEASKNGMVCVPSRPLPSFFCRFSRGC
jgi:hypothetical protein